MANDVFANGLEIACKAADGMSNAAFPDPCFTPPPPNGGWVLVPYANTALAKDLENCSTTVFISGLPVAKKDISFIKTSTGNEPAAGPMGQKTGVKKGKAYFTSWSMDVKVEGLNVCRHTDGMTHNHGSMTGNTGVWKYLDTANEKAACKRDFEKIEKACGGKQKKKGPRNRTKWVDVGHTVDWKKKNCGGLLSKPFNLEKMTDKEAFLNDISDKLKQINGIDQAIEEATDQVMGQLAAAGLKFAGKQVLKKVPVVGWIWQAATIKDDVEAAADMKDLYDAAKSETERMSKQITNFRKDLNDLKNAMENGDYEGAAGKVADWQRTAATANKCTRARKCMLVPMKDTDKQSGGTGNNKGCCPGQTGHHLIPGAYITGAGASGCGSYKYKDAPVVCAEGTNDTNGSHGAAHGAMDDAAADRMDKASETLSYDDARDAAIESHTKTFPFSLCSKKCLQAQMDNYHKKKAGCNDSAQLKYKKMGPKESDIGGTI